MLSYIHYSVIFKSVTAFEWRLVKSVVRKGNALFFLPIIVKVASYRTQDIMNVVMKPLCCKWPFAEKAGDM